MTSRIKKVIEIPLNPEFNVRYEISPSDLGYFTHSFFKYPCKFIPNIPKWAILKYTKPNNFVLDCFAGSGTTLVESVILKRNALGVDFDKLSILLCKVKTILLADHQIKKIKHILDFLFDESNIIKKSNPDLNNLNHWFPKKNIHSLSVLKSNIDKISDIIIKNFLLVCFASIIKKCSYTDDNSPKPYVSKRYPKKPSDVKKLFFSTVNTNLDKYIKSHITSVGKSYLISEDARNINAKNYYGKVDLAITSPPYINAFDYVRSLRLENAWLGFYGDTNIINIKRKQVGTEYFSSSIYLKKPQKTNIIKLDNIINKVYKIDKKRAHVILKFFKDMKSNFLSVNKLLKNDSHYIIVIGKSKIRNVIVPSHEILIQIAKECGFELHNKFSYVIKNRYLRIPRSGRGGLIKNDWVIDLKKIN